MGTRTELLKYPSKSINVHTDEFVTLRTVINLKDNHKLGRLGGQAPFELVYSLYEFILSSPESLAD